MSASSEKDKGSNLDKEVKRLRNCPLTLPWQKSFYPTESREFFMGGTGRQRRSIKNIWKGKPLSLNTYGEERVWIGRLF